MAKSERTLFEWVRNGPRLANLKGVENCNEAICVHRAWLWMHRITIHKHTMSTDARVGLVECMLYQRAFERMLARTFTVNQMFPVR